MRTKSKSTGSQLQKKRGSHEGCPESTYVKMIISGKLCFDKFSVHPGDELDVYPLRTGSLALIMVGAVTETACGHGFSHVPDTRCRLAFSLWQYRQLGNLGTGEQHGSAIRTTGNAGPATDTFGGIHGLIGNRLGNQNGIAVGNAAGMTGGVPTGLDDLVQS